MIQKNIVKQPKSQVEVSISADWVDIEPKWNETLTKLAADLELPGFRKGSAPLPMVEQSLGSKLQEEVLKVVQPQFLIEALKGSDIVPIDYPQYQLISFTKGGPLQYKAMVTNRPAVSVGEYKTIKVVKSPPKPSTEEEINKVIDDLFKRWQTRPEAQVSAPQNPTGQNVGSINFNGVTSPAPIANGVIPEPNDEFAKAMGAVTLNDLREKVRKDLDGNINYNSELDWEEAILQEVAKITTVELPEVLINDELNRMLVSLQRRVADMGLLLDDYLKTQKETVESIKNKWRVQAEQNVRMELGLAEIARQENITITDAELQAEIDKIQDSKVKNQFSAQEPRLQLRYALRQTRTLDLLKKLVFGGGVSI